MERQVPFCVSYSPVLARHAFHLLRVDPAQLSYEAAHFTIYTDQFQLPDTRMTDPFLKESRVLTETIFQEPGEGPAMTSCLLTKHARYSEFLVYLLVPGMLKVYHVRPFATE